MHDPLSAEGVRLLRLNLCPRAGHLARSDLVKLLLEVAARMPRGGPETALLARDIKIGGAVATTADGKRSLIFDIEKMMAKFDSGSIVHTLLQTQAMKLDPDFKASGCFPAFVRTTLYTLGELGRAEPYSRGWSRRLRVVPKGRQSRTATESESRTKAERVIDDVLAASTPAEALERYQQVVTGYVESPTTNLRTEIQRLGERLPFRTAVVSEPFNRLGDSKSCVRGYAALEIPLPTPAPPRSALEITAVLRSEFPWMIAAVDAIELDLMLSSQFDLACTLTPKLLVGDAGSGKTSFCVRVAELLTLPHQVVNVAGATSPRLLVGSSRGWASARPALPAEIMAQAGRGHCLLVLDEIDKEGSGDYSGRFSEALLNFLEPSTAVRYLDECLLSRCDFTGVNWLCTSNDVRRVSSPLLSRLQLIECAQPRPEHMLAIAESVVTSLRRRYRVTDDFELLDSQGRFELEALAPAAGTARACAQLARAKVGESLRRKVRGTEGSKLVIPAALLH